MHLCLPNEGLTTPPDLGQHWGALSAGPDRPTLIHDSPAHIPSCSAGLGAPRLLVKRISEWWAGRRGVAGLKI